MADVGFGLGNQADKLYTIENPNKPRTNQFAGYGQSGAVVERAGERFQFFTTEFTEITERF